MIHLSIDGQAIETEPSRTVLEVARQHGIHIPTLCYHEALAPFAACRLCVVEIATGRGTQLVASCAYPCSEGLVIHTGSDMVLRSRRMTLELLMATARDVPVIQQMAEELGVTGPRFTMPHDGCILCGLCVRACREIVGVAAISVANRGIEKRVGSPFRVASADCIECGTCVLVCPTGAITLADITGGAHTVHPWESDLESVDCRVCSQHDLDPHFGDYTALLSGDQAPALGVELEALP
jgi:NADH dehydrogenase/NADH:ubiquinone oxidoreductase subunit G